MSQLALWPVAEGVLCCGGIGDMAAGIAGVDEVGRGPLVGSVVAVGAGVGLGIGIHQYRRDPSSDLGTLAVVPQ